MSSIASITVVVNLLPNAVSSARGPVETRVAMPVCGTRAGLAESSLMPLQCIGRLDLEAVRVGAGRKR